MLPLLLGDVRRHEVASSSRKVSDINKDLRVSTFSARIPENNNGNITKHHRRRAAHHHHCARWASYICRGVVPWLLPSGNTLAATPTTSRPQGLFNRLALEVALWFPRRRFKKWSDVVMENESNNYAQDNLQSNMKYSRHQGSAVILLWGCCFTQQ